MFYDIDYGQPEIPAKVDNPQRWRSCAGQLTVEKKGKKNVFSGRILEIEGLPDLEAGQAFELSATAACANDQ